MSTNVKINIADFAPGELVPTHRLSEQRDFSPGRNQLSGLGHFHSLPLLFS